MYVKMSSESSDNDLFSCVVRFILADVRLVLQVHPAIQAGQTNLVLLEDMGLPLLRSTHYIRMVNYHVSLVPRLLGRFG